jgi:hypothetical protein
MKFMIISSTYICPIKGLASLKPPDPFRLGEAGKAAESIGIKRLILPILEEPLIGPRMAKVEFLDGLIQALDQVVDAGIKAWLIAPARRVLGLDWVPPYLVNAAKDPKANPVFLEGKIRNLRPYNWWKDVSIINKRIENFRELISAVSGHPTLTGWILMDRDLDWFRPEIEVAHLVLKSYLAEIKERDENITVFMGLNWSEILNPVVANVLSKQVDGLRLSGLDNQHFSLEGKKGFTHELLKTAYIGTMAQWVFQKPIEVEVGWGTVNEMGVFDEVTKAFEILAKQGIPFMSWLNLVDPEPSLQDVPPWAHNPGLGKVGLFDNSLAQKEHMKTWLNEFYITEAKEDAEDFIDISFEEYLNDSNTHFIRLWDHFKDKWL